MKTFYISFGQTHTHSLNGKTIDKNCLLQIEARDSGEAGRKAYDLFGAKWSRIYDEKPPMEFFPRGIITQ